jgi:hypothetical protein
MKVENGYDIVLKSTTHKDVPEVEGIIRAKLNQTLKLRSNENKTEVSLISQMDVGGWVPTYVVRKIQRIMPQRLSQQMYFYT